MATRYMIVCQARTGSTMLSTALQQHPEICAHGEVLNARSDDNLEFYGLDYHHPGAIIDILRAELWRAPDHYIDKYVFECGRFKAAGFKFKYEELSNPLFHPARTYVMRNTNIRIIHMTRQNIWKRFLSEYIALNVTKAFNSTAEAIVVPSTSFRIPVKAVEAALNKTVEWQDQMHRLFGRHQSIGVTYEDFSVDPDATFARITDFLGVSRMEFRPSTKKIKSGKSPRELILNYDEIVSTFKGTPFEPMFSES